MDFVTTGDIARQLGADRDAVNYALRKTKVEHVGRAGIVRLFPGGAVEQVKEYLANREVRRRKP